MSAREQMAGKRAAWPFGPTTVRIKYMKISCAAFGRILKDKSENHITIIIIITVLLIWSAAERSVSTRLIGFTVIMVILSHCKSR